MFNSPAFQYGSREASAFWEGRIPSDAGIVLTHGPPRNHLNANWAGDGVGCEYLLQELRGVKPLLVVFGHIHESAGQTFLMFDPGLPSDIRLVNAAVIAKHNSSHVISAVRTAIGANRLTQEPFLPILITI